ncbi:AraC family transcriptional regulator [Lacrimispora amygdalina]|uniref:AraC family transcriptional regulator n=1 Tax=Lacrimispora amygdalina TaxID=253257 RepID=A0A3E2N3Z3_9FIRM|nr:helix-turn-helix domain-containing protein [Clostridium indicum]RFZ75703.1 AraC family transcriptional regulator [Clostridium indicum]
MDTLSSMNNALSYIEEHLIEDIDYSKVSKIAYCSEYHFKRMFSFLSGLSLSEYIRRRRLTLAALDLKDRDLRIIDIAVKYGYNSADSFSRAFHSMHGILPSEARSENTQLKAYPRNIDSGTWAVFESIGPFPETLQNVWGRIYSEWFPSSGYEAVEGPEILWNESPDTGNPKYRSEIWIPVKKE